MICVNGYICFSFYSFLWMEIVLLLHKILAISSTTKSTIVSFFSHNNFWQNNHLSFLLISESEGKALKSVRMFEGTIKYLHFIGSAVTTHPPGIYTQIRHTLLFAWLSTILSQFLKHLLILNICTCDKGYFVHIPTLLTCILCKSLVIRAYYCYDATQLWNKWYW